MADPLSRAKAKIRKVTRVPRMPKPPSMSQLLGQLKSTTRGAFKPAPARGRSGKVRIKWNLDGFRQIRVAPRVQAHIAQLAAEIATRAGDGYETRPVETGEGRTARARVAVLTGTDEARRDNARNQTLLRALG